MDVEFVDLIVGLVVLAYLLDGLRRGLFAALVDLAALVLALLFALVFFRQAADLLRRLLTIPLGFATAGGFFLIWLVALALFSLLGTLVFRLIPRFLQRSLPSRLLALAPALLHGLLVAALALSLLVSLPLSDAFKSAILHSRSGATLVTGAASLSGLWSEVLGGAVQESLNLLTVHPGSEERVALNFTIEAFEVDAESEQLMVERVNAERRSAGLAPLRLDERLRAAARSHSRDMFTRGYFGHVSPEGTTPADRLRAAGVNFRVAGENLALAPNLEIAHQGLMNSAGHRANIRSQEFGRIGIGVLDGGRYGRIFTQEFAD